MTDDERSERRHALVSAHLKAACARERHIYVARSNYDDNLPMLRLLADGADLERATALLMFWYLGADYHARLPADRLPDHAQDKEALLRLIESRYADSFYTVDTLYYDPRDTDNDLLPDEYASLGPIVRPINALMYEATHGREWVDLDDDAYDDGLPMHLVEQIEALFDE